MGPTLACIAPAGRAAEGLAAGVEARAPGERPKGFSLAGYLAAANPPARIVLCPLGASVASDLEFLAKASRRLLWPAPSDRFEAAIGGLRGPSGGSRPTARRGPAARTSNGLSAALLLEGEVGLARARAALAASGPRDWIVETPRSVRISTAHLAGLARAGVRWAALEPVTLVALYATPALARARARWRPLLPPATPVWTR
jgi:hypothetical protein